MTISKQNNNNLGLIYDGIKSYQKAAFMSSGLTMTLSQTFGLRHWATGAEKLPRAHFSENSAPAMAH